MAPSNGSYVHHQSKAWNQNVNPPKEFMKRPPGPRQALRFLAVSALALSPAALGGQAGCLTYVAYNDAIYITRYTCREAEVTVSGWIDGLPVIAIVDGAFSGCDSLTNVIIPDGVTYIGDGAFSGCSNLAGITIPGSVTHIGEMAFSGCSSLASVTVPNGITEIGVEMFYGCSSLTSLTLPDSITLIAMNAFVDCSRLTSLTIPTNVTAIGDWAFQECASLTSLTIPSSVTSIGLGALSYCSSLTNIAVDPLNPSYAEVEGLLFNKTLTALIQCPGGKAGSYTVPSTVTTVGEVAFGGCSNLSSITVPSSVTNIEAYGFSDCPNLTAVQFRGQPPSLGLEVFDDADQATVYYVPGIAGWGSTLGGRPTAPWYLPKPVILSSGPSFGVATNRFGFIVSWATNAFVLVEVATNLANPVWTPLDINVPNQGWFYFSDPHWTDSPARFYRLWSP